MTSDTEDSLVLDPIADGEPPSMSATRMALIGIWTFIIILSASDGDWLTAGLCGTIILVEVTSYFSKRAAYFKGYVAAVRSVADQIDARVEE